MGVFLNGSLLPKSSSLEDRRSRLLADRRSTKLHLRRLLAVRAPRACDGTRVAISTRSIAGGTAKNCSLYQGTLSAFKSISFTGIAFKTP